MPPKPIEDIDFPDLSEKILELLYALWIFACDICLVLWSYVSQAFWAAWTYPPFETFRNEFIAALIALCDYILAHPVTSMAISILAFIVLPAVFDAIKVGLLRCLGFRKQGVLHGSYATSYQSTSYGESVPRRSTFSRYQSQGVKGGSGYRAAGASSS